VSSAPWAAENGIDLLVGGKLSAPSLIEPLENSGPMLIGNNESFAAACRCDLLEHLGRISLPVFRQLLDLLDGVFKYLDHRSSLEQIPIRGDHSRRRRRSWCILG